MGVLKKNLLRLIFTSLLHRLLLFDLNSEWICSWKADDGDGELNASPLPWDATKWVENSFKSLSIFLKNHFIIRSNPYLVFLLFPEMKINLITYGEGPYNKI